MKRAFILAGLSVYLMASCKSKQQADLQGAYAMETSFEVKHEFTGKVVGNAVIRDTLYLQQADDGFQVTEHRWQKNDFDQDGWQNRDHSSGIYPYKVKFDEKLSSLVEPNNFAPPIKVNADRQELVISNRIYKKLEDK